MPQRLPATPLPLFNSANTRTLEQAALAWHPQPSLMQRAGRACAQLAQALAPHAQHMWVLCGPGNNGGDGLAAAAILAAQGRKVTLTWLGQRERCSSDTLVALQQAQNQAIHWSDTPPALQPHDLIVDALLGLGLHSQAAANPRIAALLQHSYTSPATVLAVDLPSGLQADTGLWQAGYAPQTPHHSPSHQQRHTLSLLTLKPGLFTADGRDAAGQIWFDDLGLGQLPIAPPRPAPTAWLHHPAAPITAGLAARRHASHKGSFGDVLVIGGQGLQAGAAMQGAAILAASAALHHGAGRVFLHLLDHGQLQQLPQTPEIMLRNQVTALAQLPSSTVVCGCGGGSSVAALLPKVLEHSARLLLDADALNAIAADAMLRQRLKNRGAAGLPTVLTPHPLEAARLLNSSVPAVQADRLAAAHTLANTLDCTVLLKGSGSIIASPGEVPHINPTGNALLATGGTGDVLAGMVAAHWASMQNNVNSNAHHAACAGAYAHGAIADGWPAQRPLTAQALARTLARAC